MQVLPLILSESDDLAGSEARNKLLPGFSFSFQALRREGLSRRRFAINFAVLPGVWPGPGYRVPCVGRVLGHIVHPGRCNYCSKVTRQRNWPAFHQVLTHRSCGQWHHLCLPESIGYLLSASSRRVVSFKKNCDGKRLRYLGSAFSEWLRFLLGLGSGLGLGTMRSERPVSLRAGAS